MRLSDFLNAATWSPGIYACTADDTPVPCAPESPAAAHWSLFGAICRAVGGFHNTEAFESLAHKLRNECYAIYGDADLEKWEQTADWEQVAKLIARVEATDTETK